MPAWLLPMIINFGKWVWHSVCRFWSVFLIGAVIVIILMQFHQFKLVQFDSGFKAGYSQCMKDHPTTQNIGTQINQAQGAEQHSAVGFSFNLWKLKGSLGI